MDFELKDCLHEIVAEKIKYLTDEEECELHELCLYLMEEYIFEHPQIMAEEDFMDEFEINVSALIHSHFDDDIRYTEDFQDEVEHIIDHATETFFDGYIPIRSHPKSIILHSPNVEKITEIIQHLRSKPQPIQRTSEWYNYRYNLITASNAHKIFDSQASLNQLIYEKCKPMEQPSDDNVKIINMVNINTAMHWGNKYEPLSVKLYEERYETTVGDFGCIKHDEYSFLGASPDGINVAPNNERYGRMLEIKNIVNREITGIPKKEYWIQMQLQMEVCNLDECDFLETKFTEYENYTLFKEDIKEDIDGSNDNICMSNDDKTKGIIIHFHQPNGSPHYVYKPITTILTQDDIDEWIDEQVSLYEGTLYNYSFINIICWKLEKVSCVLVCRNREWFKAIIKDIERTWNTIERERVTGFAHRMPKHREPSVKQMSSNDVPKCLLTIIKT